ncbi:uncharacterized protein LOC141912623 [Tubulanus polymorphus]|uniref:uncharacterized protein LOC141912623 n=1 Tax=Tubulanus polymorphus TaxID=672921 RepID=UPI003DA5515B
MVDDWVIKTMYATKRRRRSVKSVKPPMKDPPKSNPSKRHRERLNGELDTLASLLPFEQSIISKLDKLSILRLSVSYLRTKAYFQAVLHDRYGLDSHLTTRSHLYPEPGFSEGDSLLQALNGFVFLVTCDGEVFFSSRTVEQYLGFHQSDIIHQSVMELIHSEDREEFKTQLQWDSQLPPDKRDMTFQEVLLPENAHLLQRNFTVRFRCLLDNTSGFITLEISGRIRMLHGQIVKPEEPPLALFAVCCPFGPLPLLDSPVREFTFKTKHKMDLSPVSIDQRGRMLFGYSDKELQAKGGYDLIHPDDLSYYAAAHQELIKTGSSGLIAYRLIAKDYQWIWLQTSSKVVYKNSKPDFVISTHRHLTDDEGKDLFGKRGTEFKLPYPLLDSDSTFPPTEDDPLTKIKSKSKKSKSQFRDYLSTGRKRKHPYREVFNGINSYPAFSPINGYPTCQNGDIKADLMYPYSGTNFGLDNELYHSYHAFTTGVYPDTFRLESDKHSYSNSYPNGYYLEPRNYQTTLQYGNGYDLMSQASKYSYDFSKYGYDTVSSCNYGLDIGKRQLGHDIQKYDELKKYADYSTDRLSHKSSLDFKSSVMNSSVLSSHHNNFLSCAQQYSSVPNSNSCSLFHPSSTNTIHERAYDQGLHLPQNHHKELVKSDPKHAVSVIQSPINSNRMSSPQNRISSLPNQQTNNGLTATNLFSDRTNPTWPSCSKNINSKISPKSISSHDGLSSAETPTNSSCSPFDIALKPDSAVALTSITSANHPSPASATTAMSVIQQHRSCEKQQTAVGGSIAVPVVKSPSWLHHLPTHHPYSDWSMDPLGPGQQRVLASGLMKGHDDNANPLLAFSEVTHTLLNGD